MVDVTVDADDDPFQPWILREIESIDDEYNQHNFKFKNQGMWVAVYYNDGLKHEYYIGQVVTIYSAEEAEVNFMQCSVQKNNTFRWPAAIDLDTVLSKYVIYWDFNVTTTNGRLWTTDIEAIENRLIKYVRLFC
ncbi:uncharacterized protein LOC117107980 [Anneissia japonica]|uniref:uncharacterized protein LOC117107980 n=1 Tax=Anneissia japonica TaxID=1529436 RepID=UPI0014257977|nr:uncharacterized protein LOC117107980 [Anneissia japonica]